MKALLLAVAILSVIVPASAYSQIADLNTSTSEEWEGPNYKR
jgi:hypothetical protein